MARNNNRVISNYAKALFEVAGGNAVKVSKELAEINKVFAENPKLASTLNDVSVSTKEQKKFIDTISKGTSKITKNFLVTVADNRSFDLLNDITVEFQDLINKSKKNSVVRVITAVEITKTQLNKLEKSAKKVFGLDNVEIKTEVDPQIIGGVILQTGSKTIDGSVRNKLTAIGQNLKTSMKERSN